MTVYLLTRHTETLVSRNGKPRSNRVVSHWAMPVSVPDAVRFITTDPDRPGRNVVILPPFRDPRFN